MNTIKDNFTFRELCRNHLFIEALYIIEQNPSIINQSSILSSAVSFKDEELIKFLIEKGACIKNCSLIMCAMNPNNFQNKYNQWNRLEMIKYLIELGCSVTEGIVSFLTDYYTPIMACCHLPESKNPSDNLNICKLLLINGSNIRDIYNISSVCINQINYKWLTTSGQYYKKKYDISRQQLLSPCYLHIINKMFSSSLQTSSKRNIISYLNIPDKQLHSLGFKIQSFTEIDNLQDRVVSKLNFI